MLCCKILISSSKTESLTLVPCSKKETIIIIQLSTNKRNAVIPEIDLLIFHWSLCKKLALSKN